jgi:hypothetical protein
MSQSSLAWLAHSLIKVVVNIYLFKIMLFDEIIKNQNISFELIMHYNEQSYV